MLQIEPWPFSKKTYEENTHLYKSSNTQIPKINSTITLNNGQIFIEKNKNQATIPLEYDTNIIMIE